MDKKERYYYDGIFYETHEQLMEASMRFANSPISPETIKRIFDHMVLEFTINLMGTPGWESRTNAELKEICSYMTIKFVEAFGSKIPPTLSAILPSPSNASHESE